MLLSIKKAEAKLKMPEINRGRTEVSKRNQRSSWIVVCLIRFVKCVVASEKPQDRVIQLCYRLHCSTDIS